MPSASPLRPIVPVCTGVAGGSRPRPTALTWLVVFIVGGGSFAFFWWALGASIDAADTFTPVPPWPPGAGPP